MQKQQLELKMYLQFNQGIYQLRSFVSHIRSKHPRDATQEDIRRYLLHLIVDKQHAAGLVNQVFNALRLCMLIYTKNHL